MLKQFDPEVVRFFIIRAHYRSPLNYSDQHLNDAKVGLTRLYTALKDFESSALPPDWQHPDAQRFAQAMNDDFNTPEALAVLFELANELNRSKDPSTANRLKSLANVLGLLQTPPNEFLQKASLTGGLDMAEEAIQNHIRARAQAKIAKNYAEADRIRGDLLKAGVVLEDSAQGTIWRRR